MSAVAIPWRLPSRAARALLVGLAMVGATFLLVMSPMWFGPHDETAYWNAAERLVAGAPLYLPHAAPNLGYVYWYPPPLAQALAPFTLVAPLGAYIAAFTLLLFGCLWWLAGGRPLLALAFVAFTPVTVELMSRNVHLILAVLIVLALRRSPVWWVPAAALKVSPVLGLVYLVLRRQWRDAALVAAVGVGVLVASVAISPGAWRDFLDVALLRGSGSDGGDGLLPVPYAARLAVGLILVVAAARLGGLRGEILLICGITIANPTLWVNAFSVLLAIVPLVDGVRSVRMLPPTL